MYNVFCFDFFANEFIYFSIFFRGSEQMRKETNEQHALRLYHQMYRQEKLRSLESSKEKDARQKSDRIYQQQRRQIINKHVDDYFN